MMPALIYIAIFCYQPMYGVLIAFKNFSPLDGIWGSPWVGLSHFERFISSPMFLNVLKNTLTISIYSLLAGFPIPILLAFALHYTQNKYFKKVVQTVTYAPHFLSVVVICSLCLILFSPRTGIINVFIEKLGNERIFFMAQPEHFKHIYLGFLFFYGNHSVQSTASGKSFFPLTVFGLLDTGLDTVFY